MKIDKDKVIVACLYFMMTDMYEYDIDGFKERLKDNFDDFVKIMDEISANRDIDIDNVIIELLNEYVSNIAKKA